MSDLRGTLAREDWSRTVMTKWWRKFRERRKDRLRGFGAWMMSSDPQTREPTP